MELFIRISGIPLRQVRTHLNPNGQEPLKERRHHSLRMYLGSDHNIHQKGLEKFRKEESQDFALTWHVSLHSAKHEGSLQSGEHFFHQWQPPYLLKSGGKGSHQMLQSDFETSHDCRSGRDRKPLLTLLVGYSSSKRVSYFPLQDFTTAKINFTR